VIILNPVTGCLSAALKGQHTTEILQSQGAIPLCSRNSLSDFTGPGPLLSSHSVIINLLHVSYLREFKKRNLVGNSWILCSMTSHPFSLFILFRTIFCYFQIQWVRGSSLYSWSWRFYREFSLQGLPIQQTVHSILSFFFWYAPPIAVRAAKFSA
jgi:hypothetical protein